MFTTGSEARARFELLLCKEKTNKQTNNNNQTPEIDEGRRKGIEALHP